MNQGIEDLLNHGVEYASELLLETGEAYPFGAFTDTIENVHPLEMEINPKNVPTIGEVVENLTKYCSEEMKEERIFGYLLAYEVQLQLTENDPPTDAIAFEIKHKDSSEKETPLFYLPFEKIEEGKKAIPGELFAVAKA